MKNISISKAYLVKFFAVMSLIAFSFSSLFAHGVDLSGRNDKDTARDTTSKPAQIIGFVGVKKGDKVLDLLGGGGYYSELLSRVVGENGEVVLQIPQAYLKYVAKEVEERLAGNRLKNVTYLLSEPGDLKLGTDKYDSAFIVLGYHDMFLKSDSWTYTADAVMDDVLKSIKPGGKLLVIDHNAAKGTGITVVDTKHRIEETYVITDLEKRGFKLVSSSELLKNAKDDHSMSVFNKDIRRKTDRFVLLFERKSK